MKRLDLTLRQIPLIVPLGVFDDFAWCEARRLALRLPTAGLADAPVGADNPPGFGFVFRSNDDASLPRERAALHVGDLASHEEWLLAPYAIDDATDGLHGARRPPGSVFELAARDVAGAFWGLHDWAHFHNHGPFEARAHTERQCDLAALVWLFDNQRALGLEFERWLRVVSSVAATGASRFAAEGIPNVPLDGPLKEILSDGIGR